MAITDMFAGNVRLNFDNKEFNHNIDESNAKVNTFKDTLVSLPASIGLGLSNVLSKVNLSDILGIGAALSGIGALKLGFNSILPVIQNVAEAAGNLINKTFDTVTKGGFERALNIEQAKFQLKGLGLEVDTFMQAADYAVSGTAYGLDSAAKAAAQLGASGVTSLTELKTALRAISGVASMTNSTYDEMAYVFTSAAGAGRIMSRQLDSIATRGLNARAALAKYLGKTEDEIRSMVSDGSIDFMTFAKAMDEAFGEHSKDANQTFSGSMSNIEAALRRIGEAFASPVIENAVNLFNAIREAFVSLKKEMEKTGIFESFGNAADIVINRLAEMVKWAQKAIENTALVDTISSFFKDIFNTIVDISKMMKFNYSGFLERIANNISVLVDKAHTLYLVLQNAFNNVFGDTKYTFFTSLIYQASNLLQILDKFNLYDLEPTFTSWFQVLKNVFDVFKDILGLDKEGFGKIFENAVGFVVNLYKNLKLNEDEIEKITNIARGFASAFDLALYVIKQILSSLKPLTGIIRPIFDMVLGIGESIANTVYDLRNTIKGSGDVTNIFTRISQISEEVKNFIIGVKDNFFETFFGDESQIKSFSEKIVEFIRNIFGSIKDSLSSLKEKGFNLGPLEGFFNNFVFIGDKFTFDTFKQNAENIISGLNSGKDLFSTIFKVIGGIILWFHDNFVTKTLDEINNTAVGVVGQTIIKFVTAITNVINALAALIGKMNITVHKFDISVIIDIGHIIEKAIEAYVKTLEFIVSMAGLILRGMKTIPTILAAVAFMPAIKNGALGIASMFSAVGNFFNPKTWERSFDNMMKNVQNVIGKIGEIRNGKDTLSKIVKSISDFIKSIAISLAVLALIPSKELAKAGAWLAGITALFGILILVFATIAKKMDGLSSKSNELRSGSGKDLFKETNKETGILSAFSRAVAVMAGSLLAVSASLSIVSKLNINVAQIGALGAFYAAIVGCLFVVAEASNQSSEFPSSDDFIGFSIAFLLMSESLVLISKALKRILTIKDLNIGSLVATSVVLIAFIGAMTGVFAVLLKVSETKPEALLAALASLMAVTFSIVSIISTMTGAFTKLNGLDVNTIKVAGAYILIAIGVIAAITAGLTLLAKLGEKIVPIVAIVAAVIVAFSYLVSSFAKAAVGISKLEEQMNKLLTTLMDADPDQLKNALANFKTVLLFWASGFGDVFALSLLSIFASIQSIWPQIREFILTFVIPELLKLVAAIVPSFLQGLDESTGELNSKTAEYIDRIVSFVNDIFFGVRWKKEGVIDIMLGWLVELWERIMAFIEENIPNVVEDVVSSIVLLMQSINNSLAMHKNEITAELTKFMALIIIILRDVLAGTESSKRVKDAAGDIIHLLVQGLSDQIGEFTDAMFMMAVKGIASFMDGLGDFNIWDAITGNFTKSDAETELDNYLDGLEPVQHSGFSLLGQKSSMGHYMMGSNYGYNTEGVSKATYESSNDDSRWQTDLLNGLNNVASSLEEGNQKEFTFNINNDVNSNGLYNLIQTTVSEMSNGGYETLLE